MNYEIENIELRNAMKLAHEKIQQLETIVAKYKEEEESVWNPQRVDDGSGPLVDIGIDI